MENSTAIEILEKYQEENKIQLIDENLFWFNDVSGAIDLATDALSLMDEYEEKSQTFEKLEVENEELSDKINELENEITKLNDRIHELEMTQSITFKRKEKTK